MTEPVNWSIVIQIDTLDPEPLRNHILALLGQLGQPVRTKTIRTDHLDLILKPAPPTAKGRPR